MENSVIYSLLTSIPWGIIFIAYCFTFLDLFYGVLVSFLLREPESHKMLKGLQRKTFVLFVPMFGVLLKAFFVLAGLPAEWSGTETINNFLGVSAISEFPVCFLLCSFVILMEIYSILEVSAKFDPRAQKIHGFFNKHVQEKIDNGEIVKRFFGKDKT